MGHAIEFIETSLFTRSIHQIATDDELRALQNDLIANPTKGEKESLAQAEKASFKQLTQLLKGET